MEPEFSNPKWDEARPPGADEWSALLWRNFLHPLAVFILEALWRLERPLSASCVIEMVGRTSASRVRYHILSLEKLGLIEAVGYEQRRGIQVPYFYWATQRTLVP